MRKCIALILCLAVMTGIVACGQSKQEAPTGDGTKKESSTENESADAGTEANTEGGELSGTLSILGWYSDEVAQGWIDHFNALYPDVKVEYQYAQAVQPYMEKLQGLIMSDSAPDLILCVAENRVELVDGNMLMDLTDEHVAELMSESCKQQVLFRDRIYAVTVGGSIGGLLVNMDLWEQAGLGEDPKTWGDLVDAMHALEDLDGITPFINNVTDATITIETPLYGATWLGTDSDYEKKIENGEKTYADYWEPIFEITKRDIYDSGLMTEELAGLPWDTALNNFALGQVGMIVGASWNFADIEAINPDLNYKIMGVPNVDGTSKYYLGDCLEPSLAIMESSENKEIALAFLESLFDEESLLSNEEQVGLIGCVDGYNSIFSENPVCADALVEGMQAGHQFMPQTYWRKNVERMRAKYVENVQAMLLTGKSPAECAADFDDIYNAE